MSSETTCLESTSHVVQGTGYFFGASSCSLALFTVATVATAVALGLLAWDGLFIYSYAVFKPLHLIWVVPLTLGFIVLDMFLIMKIAEVAGKAVGGLASLIKNCGDKMILHYRQAFNMETSSS